MHSELFHIYTLNLFESRKVSYTFISRDLYQTKSSKLMHTHARTYCRHSTCHFRSHLHFFYFDYKTHSNQCYRLSLEMKMFLCSEMTAKKKKKPKGEQKNNNRKILNPSSILQYLTTCVQTNAHRLWTGAGNHVAPLGERMCVKMIPFYDSCVCVCMWVSIFSIDIFANIIIFCSSIANQFRITPFSFDVHAQNSNVRQQSNKCRLSNKYNSVWEERNRIFVET